MIWPENALTQLIIWSCKVKVIPSVMSISFALTKVYDNDLYANNEIKICSVISCTSDDYIH